MSTKRPYRKITPETIARFKAETAIQGNGTKAVEVLEPGYSTPHNRALEIRKKAEIVGASDYIEQSIDKIAVAAIDRVGSIVHSEDEAVALKASTYILDQKRGKAVQKTESHNINLNIESVLQ